MCNQCRNKKQKSIMKKKKKHDKIVLLRKNNLNTIEFLISKTLIDSYISHEEFISVNDEKIMQWNKKIGTHLCNIIDEYG